MSCLTSLRWGWDINQEQDACRYVACPGAQPVGTESLPRDIIAPLSDLYPRRLWGKPEEVNVRSHVGSDALNLRKSGPGLRVHGFWKPFDLWFHDISYSSFSVQSRIWKFRKDIFLLLRELLFLFFGALDWIQGLTSHKNIMTSPLLLLIDVWQDLPHRPKYLLTLTVGLKQKDFVNQCVQKVCSLGLVGSSGNEWIWEVT